MWSSSRDTTSSRKWNGVVRSGHRVERSGKVKAGRRHTGRGRWFVMRQDLTPLDAVFVLHHLRELPTGEEDVKPVGG